MSLAASPSEAVNSARFPARLRRAVALVAAAAAAAAASACGDDPVSPSDRVRGEYQLVVVTDGAQPADLPVTIEFNDGSVITVQSGRIALSAGRAYQLEMSVLDDGVPQTVTSEGTYEVDDDDVITFDEVEGNVGFDFDGEVEDGQLTLELIPGLGFVFVDEED
jgi:hypothetical protein